MNATQNNPFAMFFDADKMKDMFKMPEMDKMFDTVKMPGLDVEGLMAAQQKNVQALIEANQVAMAGYQELYKRQVALVESQIASTKDKIAELQGAPMNTESAQKNLEEAKAAFDKLVADVKEMAEMAQKANTDAFDIIKSRFEEALAEFKAGAEKMTA